MDEMEVANGRDQRKTGRKRKKSGCEVWRNRQHIAEVEKGGLRMLLQQKKSQLKDLRVELSNRKSRVMDLEAEKYFLGADLHEQSQVIKALKEKLATVEKKNMEMVTKDKEKEWKCFYRSKLAVLKAFKWEENKIRPVVLRAICAFWDALSGWAPDLDAGCNKKRMSQGDRMAIWMEITLTGWSGKVKTELEKEFVASKRFCPIRMTKASDVDSRFNVSAATEIGHCAPSRKKYERGLIPSDQTCRRVMQCVYNAAVRLGFSSFPVEEVGNVWCWGDAQGRFTNGVNRYVYEVYCKIDLECTIAPAQDPWLVPLTGDLARVSFRGKQITMCGVKQADIRLPSQKATGKTMNQSRHMYTPALAGYRDESKLMPFFREFLRAFMDIAKRGYCVVDSTQHKVNIYPFLVADMAFEHKFLRRGGGSAKTTHFCMFCSSTCHFRHKGYPGGCRKCRRLGTVYDEVTGVQKCLHHEPCKPEFLEWEKQRFEELSQRVSSNIPESKIPTWESVGALREECWKRCKTPTDRAEFRKKTTHAQLEKWLLKRCRQGCTLTAIEAHGVRFCPFEIVKKDLEERQMVSSGQGEQTDRNNLELVLREEEEWEQMKMYRRDTRFSSTGEETSWEIDRTVLDMLHCPMRMHEKVLNMLYQEILNGKTKNEVNGKPTVAKRKKKALDEAALGQEVAKLFTNSQGAPQLHRGIVTKVIENGKNAVYTITFDHGNVEDLNTKDYKEAHKLALLLETDASKEATRLLKQERKVVAPALEQLSDVIRTLGSLGQTWTHQWDEHNTKALQNIKLPYDQSKLIFRVQNIPSLVSAIDIAVPSNRSDHRKVWKLFIEEYIHVIAGLTKSEEFTADEMDKLETRIDKCYRSVIDVGGMKSVTNYFHYLGSGHIMWLTRKYGNLWRFRNEGAESQNSTLSLRYNKFNNRGGNKGNNKDKTKKDKCLPFQVLGSWMARLTMWHLGLADALFVSDIDLDAAVDDSLFIEGTVPVV